MVFKWFGVLNIWEKVLTWKFTTYLFSHCQNSFLPLSLPCWPAKRRWLVNHQAELLGANKRSPFSSFFPQTTFYFLFYMMSHFVGIEREIASLQLEVWFCLSFKFQCKFQLHFFSKVSLWYSFCRRKNWLRRSRRRLKLEMRQVCFFVR